MRRRESRWDVSFDGSGSRSPQRRRMKVREEMPHLEKKLADGRRRIMMSLKEEEDADIDEDGADGGSKKHGRTRTRQISRTRRGGPSCGRVRPHADHIHPCDPSSARSAHPCLASSISPCLIGTPKPVQNYNRSRLVTPVLCLLQQPECGQAIDCSAREIA